MPPILHLFNIFGALTEKVFLNYTLGLASRGFEITAGHETLAPEAPPVPLRLVRLARVLVEPTDDIPAQMRRIAREITDPAMRNLLNEDFALVHGHFGPRILQAAPWLLRGTPVIVSCYGYDVGRLLRDPCRAERYRWAAEQGATFVALAQYMQHKLARLGIPLSQLHLIRLGIDMDVHAFDPRPAPGRPRFVFIGRFVGKKGADVLVDAMARLANDLNADATLDLIGGGPMEAELRQKVSAAGIEDRVRFVGIVPFERLFDSLHGATALVQPSVTAADGDAEGAPMVLMHAQAAGVPCITTAHSGNPEVLPPDGQQSVVPERDAAALAAAMARMTELSPRQRRSLQISGRRWIEEHYDLRQTVDQCDRLYRTTIEAHEQATVSIPR